MKSLETRIAQLEANHESKNYGPVLGRQLAELYGPVLGYTGEKLEEMARYFADQPRLTHEEMVAILQAEKRASEPQSANR